MRRFVTVLVVCTTVGVLVLAAGCKGKTSNPGSAESSVPADAKAQMQKMYSKGNVPIGGGATAPADAGK